MVEIIVVLSVVAIVIGAVIYGIVQGKKQAGSNGQTDPGNYDPNTPVNE